MHLRALIVTGVVLVDLALAVPAVGSGKPSLRVVRDLPLTVQGAHFRTRESVRVTVVMGERRWAKVVRAGAGGGFTVAFTGVRLNRCALPLVISARGNTSGTVRTRMPVRDCAVP